MTEQIQETDSEFLELRVLEHELTTVKLDIELGDKFRTFKEFQAKLEETTRINFVRFAKRDSRTLQAASQKTKRYFNSSLEFYYLKYGCFYSPKFRPRGTGKRKKKSLAMEYDGVCPAIIVVKASADGQYLEVCHIDYDHNHPVNEAYFQKLLPKKRAFEKLLEDSEVSDDDGFTDEDLHKIVVKKCKQIARFSSNCDRSGLREVIKNLNDYMFYLKYTTPKLVYSEESQDQLEDPTDVNEDEIVENVQIIVEGQELE